MRNDEGGSELNLKVENKLFRMFSRKAVNCQHLYLDLYCDWDLKIPAH